MILVLVIMFFFLVLIGSPFLTKQDAKLLACLGSTVGMILLLSVLLNIILPKVLALKAYTSSAITTKGVDSNETVPSSNARISFDSLTVTGYSVGSPVPCSYSFNGSVDGSAPIQSGSVKGDGDIDLNWYAYPMTVITDNPTETGSIASCGFLFDSLSANCNVNLSFPDRNGGNKYILNAMASFNNGVSESFGIAGGTVRFSGLQYGKSYTFGDKSLEVAEDGTAVGEFTVPDYGYVDSKFPDLYSIRLVRAEGNSLETELILYVKRPIKSVVDARAGK
jgi:hypothetical protein